MTVSSEYDEVAHENGDIEIKSETTVIFQEPLATKGDYSQFDIITTLDTRQNDIHVEYVERSAILESESLSEMFVHRKIKLGNSVLLVDLTTILDLSDEGFILSPNGEVPEFKPPKDQGKRRIIIFTPTLLTAPENTSSVHP